MTKRDKKTAQPKPDAAANEPVRADIPDEVLEDALRSVEDLERELGLVDESAPDVPRFELDEPASDEDIEALMRLLEEGGDAAAGAPSAEPATAPAEDLEDGDAIIARLLAQEPGAPPAGPAAPEPATEAAAPRPSAEPDARLVALLDIKEAQLQELLERFKRLQEDFESFRKRVERDRADYQRFAGEKILLAILPILDSLQRALAQPGAEQELGAFREGIALIYKQFQDVLSNLGLEPIPAVGQPFDPQFHEAALHIEDPMCAPGHVAAVYQNGYLLHGRLLRPAKVAVAKGGPGGSPATRGEEN